MVVICLFRALRVGFAEVSRRMTSWRFEGGSVNMRGIGVDIFAGLVWSLVGGLGGVVCSRDACELLRAGGRWASGSATEDNGRAEV